MLGVWDAVDGVIALGYENIDDLFILNLDYISILVILSRMSKINYMKRFILQYKNKTMENNEINEMMPSLNASSSPTSTSNSSKDSTSVNIKKKDLSDPTVTANISKLGNVNINVIDEEVVVKPEAIIEPKDQKLLNTYRM
jgi:hypothetical protein